jgi:hypothetical protein
MVRLIATIGLFLLFTIPVKSQYSMGVSGLLNIPSADMQPHGRFMGGANYLPKQLMPEAWNYNTANYFLNITFLSFVEVAYRCTLFSLHSVNNEYHQDRSVSLRLRPLKESRYLPAVVVGSNDALTTLQLNPLEEVNGNRYFSSVYAVATKHLYAGEHDISLSLGGFAPMREHAVQKGVFAGIAYRPPFMKPLTLIVEYDTNGVNAGASVRLFNHISAHLFSYNFQTVSGGLRYEFDLIH